MGAGVDPGCCARSVDVAKRHAVAVRSNFIWSPPRLSSPDPTRGGAPHATRPSGPETALTNGSLYAFPMAAPRGPFFAALLAACFVPGLARAQTDPWAARV